MTQTFNRVKDSLVALLQNQDHKVISLKGKWGTGKTFLWRSVEIDLFGNKKVSESPIYVSMFGAKSINDLKLRIMQNTYLKDASTFKKVLNTGGNILAGAYRKYIGNSAEEAALIWLPELTKNRLIVIDDIERKHKLLDIDEFLGMLDEYSENHKTRFLILLNTDQLLDQKLWSTLHEKVIDAELVLDPTVSESFDIAAIGNASWFLPAARAAVLKLNINNIRVIRRILKSMKQLTDAINGVDGVSTDRWVPSTALLTACHYRAVENGPPFEYIKSFNQFRHFLDNEKGIERDPKELEWDILIDKMGMQVIDAYEEIMQQFLQTGLLDIDRLRELFEHYKKEEANTEASEKQNEFFDAVWWDAQRSENDLLAMARKLNSVINGLGPDSISDIVSIVEKLGDDELAQQLLDAWLLSIDTRPEYQQMGERSFDITIRKYHPDVIKKMDAIRGKQHPPLTVIEVANSIIDNSGWGDRERISLRSSTVKNYEDALNQISGNQLKRFLTANLGWAKNTPYDENFKIGTDNFLVACFNIYSTTPTSRLSKIIHRTFQGYGLAEKLDPSAPTLITE